MKQFTVFLFVVIICGVSGCRDLEYITGTNEDPEEIEDLSSYPDWSEETHSANASLDYDVVFNEDEVLRFDIKINEQAWDEMQSDLASILGSGGFPQGPPGMGGGGGDVDTDPMWVDCSLKFNGLEWYHVGIRYKGNSSLRSTYESGNNKLSFKLDLDEFENEYPALTNQRFYGFKQLNLKNNYDDASMMREKVGADLFREFGLASSKAAFCAVYIDHGEGSQYFGLYTLVEEVDDSVIKTQFSNGNGNLYKPDGGAASFAYGTYDEGEMEIKTNEDSADFADVRALYDIINSSDRTANVEAWKTDLESVLHVDQFLKWLAANTVIQNWDTYGNMTHNYYLYNDPENNLLTWIPWDNNEAFQEGKMQGAMSLSLNEAGSNWPLISYIIDDSAYETLYKEYLQHFIDEVFVPADIITRYSSYYELIREYAYAEEYGYTFLRSDAEFDQAVANLKSHVQSRNDAVISFLDQENK